MSTVGQREIHIQREVVQFFSDALGYRYLAHWKDRGGSHIEEAFLRDWLKRQAHGDKLITKALHELCQAAALGGGKTLYDANREVYGLLRYGVKIRPEVGEQTVMVWLIDWENPENNDFAVAEEVTVAGVETQSAKDGRPRGFERSETRERRNTTTPRIS
ncbi:MAG: type I restriction endonuclease [Gammaproteobacteria bacterium]